MATPEELNQIRESLRTELNIAAGAVISVNGQKNLSSKWEGPNGDKLINDLITDSCKNV